MEDELERLLAANQEFYDAFDRGDIPALETLWAAEHAVSCAHPGWDVITGRDEVLASWRNILANPQAPRVQCRDPFALFHGDFGAVICHELLADGVLVATNLFAQENGTWRMVHHHSGSVMALPGRRASRSVH